MAERRMFAKTIIDSDAFIDMPLSTQALYFHLSMRADDEGFINNPKKIQRMIGASDDDLKVLILKRFILPFDSGVVVIKHWKIHNYIQKDRFKPTVYTEEKSLLECKGNGAYTEVDTGCIHDGYNLETQVRVGKESLVKCSLVKCSSSSIITDDEYTELCDSIGKSDCDYYIERVKAFKEKNPEATFNVKATILKWHREDEKESKRKQEKSSNPFLEMLHEEGGDL